MSGADFVNAIISFAVGGALGWVVGGIHNAINGKQFSGKPKETRK